MKKGVLSLFFAIVFGYALSSSAQVARTARGLSESEQLGITAGTALACNAGAKLDDFELIASRIIANQAPTAEVEKEEYTKFAQAKLRAYREQKDDPQMTCGEVLASFRRLPIFRAVMYADGGVKMPNGSFLKPLRPVVRPASQKTAAVKSGITSSKTVKTTASGQKKKTGTVVKPKQAQSTGGQKKSIAVRPIRKK